MRVRIETARIEYYHHKALVSIYNSNVKLTECKIAYRGKNYQKNIMVQLIKHCRRKSYSLAASYILGDHRHVSLDVSEPLGQWTTQAQIH